MSCKRDRLVSPAALKPVSAARQVPERPAAPICTAELIAEEMTLRELRRARKLKRGSGNAFRDLGQKKRDAKQVKAILTAEIIRVLDRERLSVRAAHGRTGIVAADFSRIRKADLGRFTVDRLMSILNRLGSRVDLEVRDRQTVLEELAASDQELGI
jgi:predicted XRE-type DNA-binding protein